MIDSPALNKFLDDLISQKHGADLSAIGRDQIKTELSPRLEKWLILKAMEALTDKSPATLKTFEGLAQGDTPPSVILKFIEENIPDPTAFFASALVDFWTLYLGKDAATA
jgi:hypothetical protein